MNKSTEKLLKRSLDGNMQVFMHHIYEFQKGLRDLILHTTHIRFLNDITATLQKKDIPYIIHPVGEKNINVFFGNEKCIRVINNIGNKKLSQYTDEEDFILGRIRQPELEHPGHGTLGTEIPQQGRIRSMNIPRSEITLLD